jgi:hypothetical protein
MKHKNMESHNTYALIGKVHSQEEIDISPQVADINIMEDINIPEKLYRYVGDVEKKGTTRNNVDLKVLRRVTDLNIFLLQKQKTS